MTIIPRDGSQTVGLSKCMNARTLMGESMPLKIRPKLKTRPEMKGMSPGA